MLCQSNPPLDRAILAAFKSAHDAGRLDVAEHLLCALECLCDEAVEASAANEAYRIISRACGSKRPKHRDSLVRRYSGPTMFRAPIAGSRRK